MKIYKKGNYIVFDSVNGVMKLEHANQVMVSKSTIDSNDFTFASDDLGIIKVSFSDIEDENGDAYSDLATFNTFIFGATGFNTASGGSEVIEVIQLACSDETTALTTGMEKVTFRMPYAMTLTDVRASLTGAGSTSGTTTIDINEGGVSILSTKLTIDFGDTTSVGATTPVVISDTSLADDAEITIDIDAVTGGANETGLKITLIGTRT